MSCKLRSSREPSFLPKKFYGLDKNQLVTKTSVQKQVKEKNDSGVKKSRKRTRSDPFTYSPSQVDELMAKRIALSPVKQALLQSCSMSNFRKVYRDEYKTLERQLGGKNKKSDLSESPVKCEIKKKTMTVTRDKVTFRISNGSLDLDELESVLNSQEEESESDEENDVVEDKSLHHEETSLIQKTSSDSSEKKFFKTRSPKENSKINLAQCGKSLYAKFVPWKSKILFSKKKNKDNLRKATISTGKEESCNTRQQKNDSADSAEKSSGFTFSSGFTLDVSEGNGSHDTEVNESHDTEVNESHDSETLQQDDQESDQSQNVSNNLETLENNNNITESPQSDKKEQYFPIFNQKRAEQTANYSKLSVKSSSPSFRKSPKSRNHEQSQMILDAGQKKIGLTQCPVCSMIYCHADKADEAEHSKFHSRHIEVLKFPGWKKERTVQEYPMDDGRVILILHDDPKYARKKVDEVNQVMRQELGFQDGSSSFSNHNQKVFMFVKDKRICGCCVAEPIQQGYRTIPVNDTSGGQRPWRCNKIPEPASVGISRLWVSAENRRSGIASKLLDCVRQWFDYGTLIPKSKVAFSDPTPDGQRFSQKYVGTPTFLVYKYNES
ncbi:N-acetyltransferase ESCO1-like isoform X2 [Physella acuta]|uniref:N-acetyltransferase ESCO1-like isoform X2 n=1 Tax=Physella acuta TaxID=109671 RepID=UPI0027DC6CB8|nr:N-acetyltransferase ESCO1-like isoform X2 [Physella acuta]